MVKVTSLLAKAGSGLRFSFGVRAWTEMEIWYIKGMQRLKLVSSENNSVFKGLIKEGISIQHVTTVYTICTQWLHHPESSPFVMHFAVCAPFSFGFSLNQA